MTALREFTRRVAIQSATLTYDGGIPVETWATFAQPYARRGRAYGVAVIGGLAQQIESTVYTMRDVDGIRSGQRLVDGGDVLTILGIGDGDPGEIEVTAR